MSGNIQELKEIERMEEFENLIKHISELPTEKIKDISLYVQGFIARGILDKKIS